MVTVDKVAGQINSAQALQTFEQLATQIGLEGGLAGWAALAKQIEKK